MVQDLQARLQEARACEGALPADIDQLQAELQREFAKVQSREAGARFCVAASHNHSCVAVTARPGTSSSAAKRNACLPVRSRTRKHAWCMASPP